MLHEAFKLRPVFLFLFAISLSSQLNSNLSSKVKLPSIDFSENQNNSSYSLLRQKSRLQQEIVNSAKLYKFKHSLSGLEVLRLLAKIEEKGASPIRPSDPDRTYDMQRLKLERMLLKVSLVNSFDDIEEEHITRKSLFGEIKEIEGSLKKNLGMGTEPIPKNHPSFYYVTKSWSENLVEKLMFRFHSSLASLKKEGHSLVVHPFPTTSMKLPVRGSVSKLSGEPFSEGSVPWAGIFINSEPDSSVKAVGAGEIVFASDFNTLKNLVILDHGNNYLTLYGNLHSLNVSLGMLIQKDDIIGKSHIKGINHRGGIYFEIRKNGTPIDPKLWFKY